MPITGKPKSVEISFGTLFSVRELGKKTEKIDVIIDVGEEEENVGEETYFHVGRVVQNQDGNKMIEIYGTGGLRTFGEVVGQMSLEEVVEAARRGAKIRGYELTDKWCVAFQESARERPRKVLLDR